MAIDFPASPTEGLVFNASPGVSFVYRTGEWQKAPMKTALPKNYIVNPAMFVSQENGSAGNAVVAAHAGYYAADQFCGQWALTGSTMNLTRWDGMNAITGSKTVYLGNVTAITPAAADYAMITQFIEGQRVADLQWGTPQAVSVVLRFSLAGNAGAGPYSIRISNSAGDRSYLAAFTAASWADIVIPIPGDTTGTWLKDTGMGMRINWIMAGGSNWLGVVGWQAGNKLILPGQYNPLTVTGGSSNWHLNSVGLYADPYKTGVPPPFVIPDFAAELRRCQRYWYKAFGFHGGAGAATSLSRLGMPHPVPMRVTPAATVRGAPRCFDGAVTGPVSSIGFYGNAYAAEIDVSSVGSAFTSFKAAQMYYQTDADYIEMNARM